MKVVNPKHHAGEGGRFLIDYSDTIFPPHQTYDDVSLSTLGDTAERLAAPPSQVSVM